MRIPPLYRDKSWQRFTAGVILGMLIGWLFFLYNFGYVYDKMIIEIGKQRTTIENLENTVEILQKDQDEMNRENQEKLTVQEIRVNFINEREVNLSELTIFELRSAVESELELIKNKGIESVFSSRELLKKAVENKTFRINNDKKYQLKIEHFMIYTTTEVDISIHAAD
ncbi:sporulation membrane protein YtrI [Alteribacter natronophilus]|uniref:sporulation membrane protein YtrI n=1 Tax=Alteribacter natronophilus TaxID=2583810 RepID=UPI00110EEA52|nr:sporulation membrane protein YtrI [Alteribacter natronophilus]TMW71711.1 hypothetical protein FGB90_11835 [Alteribacter natronophilus]